MGALLGGFYKQNTSQALCQSCILCEYALIISLFYILVSQNFIFQNIFA